MSSYKVSVIVRNISQSQVFLKKGVQVARVVSALLVELAELSPEMKVVLGTEDKQLPLSVIEQQRRLLEKLGLGQTQIGLLTMLYLHKNWC